MFLQVWFSHWVQTFVTYLPSFFYYFYNTPPAVEKQAKTDSRGLSAGTFILLTLLICPSVIEWLGLIHPLLFLPLIWSVLSQGSRDVCAGKTSCFSSKRQERNGAKERGRFVGITTAGTDHVAWVLFSVLSGKIMSSRSVPKPASLDCGNIG